MVTIREVKEDILQRARLRQETLERGAYDVPLHYSPLPLAELLDLLSQLEYRHNFLELAVPPPHPALHQRLKRFFKSLICKSFRWLMIRQVEFNTVALQQARAAAELMSAADQNHGEFMAALTALRLQVNALAQRLDRLETVPTGSESLSGNLSEEVQDAFLDKNAAYHLYLHYLKDHLPALTINCAQGDLLKLLISEGVTAEGIATDPALAEYCRERELPVIRAEAGDYLGQLADGCLGGIYLNAATGRQTPRELPELLGGCWSKLAKGGILIVDADNPDAPPHPTLSPQGGEDRVRGAVRPGLSVEVLRLLLDDQSFTLVDSIFSLPASKSAAEIAQTSTGLPFDRKQYRAYAIVARK
jgi:hypothetical protein